MKNASLLFRRFSAVAPPSMRTGAGEARSVGLLGGCPCENRSDSDAANRSLARSAIRRRQDELLRCRNLNDGGEKVKFRRELRALALHDASRSRAERGIAAA